MTSDGKTTVRRSALQIAKDNLAEARTKLAEHGNPAYVGITSRLIDVTP